MSKRKLVEVAVAVAVAVARGEGEGAGRGADVVARGRQRGRYRCRARIAAAAREHRVRLRSRSRAARRSPRGPEAAARLANPAATERASGLISGDRTAHSESRTAAAVKRFGEPRILVRLVRTTAR